ncbi:Bug family tripartite tricarboxylate transporter substrate binding protein [Pseudorhodoferax sp.]|uniref:Bug family tripartite tricarboxylate transporter substrate binding protein n=1 Tax=Pseudorhodoferax sp. TaxID=1993553 RepID=UPI002DD62FD4|nr:tripartite tricarboxylate transporter substrate-binding protein [Pseudorhodoferax sp.]
MDKRSTLVTLALALVAPSAFAQAQDYPNKPVKIIVPVSAGSGTDATARFVSTALAKAWNASLVVENRPGAGAALGSELVAKAPADGYTLLFAYSAHYSNPFVMNVGFDAVKDFEPIARLASSALIVATAPNSKLRTIKDVIAAAKAQPGGVSYASAGNGSTGHMAGALLGHMAGIELNHIPYKAASQVPVDAAAGVVDFMIGGLASALPLVKANRLHVIAVTTDKRSANIPEVPTVAESGLPGYENSSPIWLLAPRGTPEAIVNKLSEALVRIAATPEFKEYCFHQGIEVDIQNAATARANAQAESDKWRRLVQLTAPANK